MFYTEYKKSRFSKIFLSLYGVVFLVGVSFLGGWYLGGRGIGGQGLGVSEPQQGSVEHKDTPPPYLLEDVDFKLFWDVWNIAKGKYLEQPVPDTKLFYGALAGIVGSLGDPYSVFFDPETAKQFAAELAGTFEGIGAEIGIKRDQLVVIAPIGGTPADHAGLKPGDKILKINGKDTGGIPLDVAVSAIRGPKATKVTLRILRNNWKEPRDFTIMRDTINVKSVTWKKLPGSIAYLKVAYFNETTPQLFEQAVQEIVASNPKGIVLDLRNNPGGFLEVGVQVASEWVPSSQVVVIQEFQGKETQPFRAQGQARFRGIPTVVLVNQGSASASEIVSGALRDYKAATLIGERTFGKGSVQTLERLPGGSAVKLTIAHWLTPLGSQINGEGIAPDVEVKLDHDDYESDQDPQLDAAIKKLSS